MVWTEQTVLRVGFLLHIFTYIDIGRCGMSANETTLHPNNNLLK